MPLPKPPARKAALLSAADFDTQAAPRTSRRSIRAAPAPAQHEAADARHSNCARQPARPRRAGRPRPACAPTRAANAAALRRPRRRRPARAPAARQRPGQALRARHQRADARPDLPVPLRGARRLPADDHAGGTRRPQEGHERGGAQRAPGQPRPRRPGDLRRQGRQPRPEGRHPAGQDRPHARPAASCSSRPRCSRSSCRPACRRARPTTRSWASCRACASSNSPEPRRGAGVQGHQHARQGARAGPGGRGLLQRQDAGRRRPAVHRRAAAAGRLLGAPRQDDGELAAGRPHLLPHQRAAGAGAADQPVRLPRDPGRGAAVRPRDRDHRQDRGAEDAARLHATPRTRSGA